MRQILYLLVFRRLKIYFWTGKGKDLNLDPCHPYKREKKLSRCGSPDTRTIPEFHWPAGLPSLADQQGPESLRDLALLLRWGK